MSSKKVQKTDSSMSMYLFTLIGLGIMAFFWFAPAMAPITPIGMKVVGIFLGMVFLWSTVDSTWPSLLGLTLLGLTGLEGNGYAGMKAVAMQAYGADTVILVLLGMVLFGSIEYLGVTKYIARWFVTRKIVNGRPYGFILMFFLACYFLSALTSPVISLLIVWSIGIELLESFGIRRDEPLWAAFNFGVFFVSTIGQPMLPFKGAQLVVLSAYSKASGDTMAFGPWILFNFIMSMILIGLFLLGMRFIFRVDVSKLQNISVEYFANDPLPPLNISQKLVLADLVAYIAMILAPGMLPKTVPGMKFLASLGVVGVTSLCIVVLMVILVGGKQVLPFQQVASKQINWGVYFLVAAAVYAAGSLSKPETGVNEFLIKYLTPILGGHSEFVFGLIMLIVALLLTNFANNAAMAVLLMPVILAFTGQMGVNPVPYVAGVGMLVFVAMLTPSASPHAGMMHGRPDVISKADIYKYGVPASIVALLLYVTLGMKIAHILF